MNTMESHDSPATWPESTEGTVVGGTRQAREAVGERRLPILCNCLMLKGKNATVTKS